MFTIHDLMKELGTMDIHEVEAACQLFVHWGLLEEIRTPEGKIWYRKTGKTREDVLREQSRKK